MTYAHRERERDGGADAPEADGALDALGRGAGQVAPHTVATEHVLAASLDRVFWRLLAHATHAARRRLQPVSPNHYHYVIYPSARRAHAVCTLSPGAAVPLPPLLLLRWVTRNGWLAAWRIRINSSKMWA
jgi:hypothetical protein